MGNFAERAPVSCLDTFRARRTAGCRKNLHRCAPCRLQHPWHVVPSRAEGNLQPGSDDNRFTGWDAWLHFTDYDVMNWSEVVPWRREGPVRRRPLGASGAPQHASWAAISLSVCFEFPCVQLEPADGAGVRQSLHLVVVGHAGYHGVCGTTGKPREEFGVSPGPVGVAVIGGE